MTNKKSTKRALLLSALSLLMCVSMLIGSTFAWFTDSVTSGNNIIKSGNLDVELEYKKVVDGKATEWATVKDKTDIFDPNALWEPGRVEVVYLKVSNLGTLELKYQLGVNVIKETLGKTEDGKDIKLSDHLVFKVVEMPNELTTYTDREAVKLAAGTEKGLTDYNGKTTALEVGGEDYVALIVYMPETVGNEANYRGTDIPTIELGINLFATQFTAEEDSFDKFYDKDAWVKGFKVYNANDLQAAINNGESAITLMDNIETAEAIEIPADANVALNLNDKTISATNSYAIENKGNLTVSGEGTISGLGGIRSTAGKLTINGGAYFGASDWNNGTYQHTLKAENTVVEINGGIFDATVNGQTNAMLNVSNGTTMTINGGTFKNVSGELSSFDPYLFHYEGDGKLIINNGDFYGGWRFASNDASTDIYGGTFALTTDGQSFQAGNTHTLKVYGGTFTFGKADTKTAVLARVADGFKAVDNGNGTYTVIPAQIDGNDLNLLAGYPGLYTDGANDYYVYDVQGLKSLNDWVSSNMWNPYEKTYNVMADINAAGFTWIGKQVSPNGDNTPGLIFNGNGKTISNLAITNGGLFSLAPNGTYATEPATFKDITFDNVTVTGDYHVGVVWGQVSGDLVLENVHVKNSNITGTYNVGGLVGSTGEFAIDASVKYVDCSVTNTTLTANGAAGGDPTGASAFMGRALGKTYLVFEGNNVAENITYVNENGLVGGGIYGYSTWANGGFAGTGTCDTFTNWNGISVVTEDTTLSDAINTGASQVVMPAGTYVVPSAVSGKTVTIIGNGETVIDITTVPTYAGLPGATITFENVVIKSDSQGEGYNRGFAHTNKITYNNCVINGTLGLNTDTEFNNCTFNIAGDYYNLWTWGADNVTLNGCTFNSDGKALLLYGGTNTKLTVNGCTFNDNGGLPDLKAAIEIGNDYNKSYELIVNNTTVNGYEINDKGINTGSTLWANKNSMGTDKLNVVIDGVDVY